MSLWLVVPFMTDLFTGLDCSSERTNTSLTYHDMKNKYFCHNVRLSCLFLSHSASLAQFLSGPQTLQESTSMLTELAALILTTSKPLLSLSFNMLRTNVVPCHKHTRQLALISGPVLLTIEPDTGGTGERRSWSEIVCSAFSPADYP